METRENGTTIKVVAGETDEGTRGIIDNPHVHPLYLHIALPAATTFSQQVPDTDNSFIYVISGQLSLGDKQRPLKAGQLGVLEAGSEVKVAAEPDSEFLLVSGQPLNEPVARGGPFVMNTREQVEQAFTDYREGRFG